ncbi:MAG: hypothetical protein AMXMBFR64_15270 [Myxococcales bacterium]
MTKQDPVDTLGRFAVPPEAEWPALYEQAIAEGWLPYPLSELLRGVVEQRAVPSTLLACGRGLFEATYWLLSALVLPSVVERAHVGTELTRLTALVTGASAGGAKPGALSMGDWQTLALSGLEVATAAREAAGKVPPVLRDLALRLPELRSFHTAVVALRNVSSVGHGTIDGTDMASVEADAAAMERAVVKLVRDLAPLRDYELLIRDPLNIVASDGTLAPVPKWSEHHARRHLLGLALLDPTGALIQSWPLFPLIRAQVEGGLARVWFLSPQRSGGLAYIPARGPREDTEVPDATAEAALESLALVLERRSEPHRRRSIGPWLPALDAHFEGHAKVLGVLASPPLLQQDFEFQAPPEIETAAARKRQALETNDMHALLDGAPALDAEPVSLFYETLDFATVQALRESGVRPRLLSASAVVLHPSEPALLLHERSLESATYPRAFHTMGGAFQPETGRRSGDRSLEDTILRELHEESRLWPVREAWPVVMTEEIPTGFVQYVALGVRATTCTPVENWEGKGRWIPFDALEPWLLRAKKWVPSGKLHVLLWLAAGAPGARDARFGGRDAHGLLAHVLERSARDYDLPAIQT